MCAGRVFLPEPPVCSMLVCPWSCSEGASARLSTPKASGGEGIHQSDKKMTEFQGFRRKNNRRPYFHTRCPTPLF